MSKLEAVEELTNLKDLQAELAKVVWIWYFLVNNEIASSFSRN